MPPLKTVRVPDGIAAPFAEAEEVVSRYFRLRKDDPEHGTIEIAGERYVLLRAASLSVEFFALVQDLYGPGRESDADEFARNILYDLAHAVGRSDAQNFHARMGLSDPIARLSAGPVHFAHAGWAFVEIDPASHPSADEDYYLIYEHPYSFEADAWIRSGKRRDFAACIMNSGYSSGWCEASFGLELVSAEVQCRAKGDPSCRFIMAPPHRIDEHVHAYFAGRGAGAVRGGAAPQPYQIPDFFVRKRIEEELRRAHQQEMEERRRVERQLAQTQKLEAVGRLTGGIAHDFNNLMAIVIANASLLAKRLPEGEPGRAFVDEIAAAGKRAAELTRQLLAFSRAQVVAPEVLEPTPIVAELTRMLGRVIGEEVSLVTRLDAGAGHVEADRGRLEQVVMNLVVNGRDAMPGGGTLTIETGQTALDAIHAASLGIPPGAYVRVTVADTGTGMDEHVLAHLFDPFFTTKADVGGTGLGLSTAYGIVRQAGGAIAVESAPGHGSRFDVFLPRVEPPAIGLAAAGAVGTLRGSETVLLAEDQAPLLLVVGRTLRELGYTVLESSSPAHALELAREHPGPIHLLLTDVIMPGMRGPDLAKRVLEARPGIKVLFMSGYVDDAGLGGPGGLGGLGGPGGAGAGADRQPGVSLIAKPFTQDVLAQRLRELLGERAG